MNTKLAHHIHQHFLEHPSPHTSADKHLKWIAYAVTGCARACGVRSNSDWKRQVVLVAITESIRYLLVDNVKKWTNQQRPAPSTGHHSFPSGHTSSAFAGATFLHQEIGHKFPALSVAAYLAAGWSGYLRVAKNRHWLKDVVAGAAVGIAAASISRWMVGELEKAHARRLAKQSGMTGVGVEVIMEKENHDDDAVPAPGHYGTAAI
ncbi:MAG TPA: phosphatase PAP2 family protein [Chitinophagaceae bacterium]